MFVCPSLQFIFEGLKRFEILLWTLLTHGLINASIHLSLFFFLYVNVLWCKLLALFSLSRIYSRIKIITVISQNSLCRIYPVKLKWRSELADTYLKSSGCTLITFTNKDIDYWGRPMTWRDMRNVVA